MMDPTPEAAGIGGLMDGPIPLRPYYCSNERCASIRAPNGRPHVVMKALLPPGSVVLVKCRYCRTFTKIQVPGTAPVG